MDSHLHAVSGVSSCLQRSQVESKQHRITRAWRLRFAVETRHKQKKGISDRKTIRRVSTCLVRRPEAGFYQSVDVVSPIDATGHP
jgi:hypothetical protein